MSDPGKAVFLSYASQDAEAAKRIADALRASGVEVWFDQNELVGGDAWDAKIRKQIKECALFVPIISPNTNSRAEGYFRLEWKLAVDRSHLLADDHPFLFPIVIGDVTDAAARVPEKFREVQWMRLRLDETPVELANRVSRLLGGASDPEPTLAVPGVAPKAGRRGKSGFEKWWWLIFPVLGLAMPIIGLLKRPTKPRPAEAVQAAAPISEARKLAERALELATDPNYTRESVWLADELCTRALALDAADAEVWAIAAFVGQTLWLHVYDSSDARRQKTRAQADRAVQLAPNSVMARLTVARNFAMVADDTEAARLLRELATAAPENALVWQNLAWASRRLDREADVAESIRNLRSLNNRPALLLTLFLEARDLRNRLRYREAEAILDELLADPPLRHAYYEKFNLLTRSWHELADAEPFIARIPMRFQQEPAFGSGIAQYWLRRGEPEKALQALARVPQDFFEEYAAREPKAYLAGWAHALAGRPTAAQAEWRNALALVEQRLQDNPRDLRLLSQKAQLLGLTGQPDGARETWKLRVELSDAASPPSAENLALFHVAVRENEQAIAAVLARWPTTTPNQRTMLMWGLRYAPWFAGIRDDPRIQRLIAEHQTFLDDLRHKSRPSTILPAAAPGADDKSVAVLAFANLSDDKANEYFSDGISEELLNVLAKVPGLKVSARTSAFHFKGKDTPISDIAKQLGVAYVVEGSVRKAGDKVRITAQLIKAVDGFNVWSDTFTRDLKDVFAVQDEIAGLIAKNLSLRLGTDHPTSGRATVPEAFELYVRGRAAWNLRTREGYAQAESLLNRAIELDPGFARAHSALADVWMIASYEDDSGGGTYGWRNSPKVAKITAKAEQALALDPLCAESHTSLASALEFGWQWDAAERAYQRAIELNPNYATARHWFGMLLSTQGKMDEAVRQLKRAAECDPLSHRILDTYARMLNQAGRPEEALAVAEQALALQPLAIQAATQKARALVLLGRADEAVALLEKAITPGANIDQRTNALHVLHLAGANAVARQLIAATEALPSSQFKVASLIVLGRPGEALAELRPADLHQNQLSNLALLSFYDPIREDPRFLQAITEVGFLENYRRARAWLAAKVPQGKK